MKGDKVATCRKLTKAQELLRKDKQWYWNKKKAAGRNNASRYTQKHQINEVDEADSINNEENQYIEEDVNTDYKGIEEINIGKLDRWSLELQETGKCYKHQTG